MTLRESFICFFFLGIIILPFDYLLGQSFGSVQVGISYIFLSIASFLFIVNETLYPSNVKITLSKAIILLLLVLFIILPLFLNSVSGRFFLVLWSYLVLLTSVFIFQKLSKKTKTNLFNVTYYMLIFAVTLDILDEFIPSLKGLLEMVDKSGIYHSGNRLRAFFDEASVLSTFIFSMLLFHYMLYPKDAFTIKSILLMFLMLSTISSLVLIYFMFYVYLYRINPLKIIALIFFPLVFISYVYDLSFIKYSFYDKVISYIFLSGSLGVDSGFIRGMYLFYMPAFIFDNPFGIGFGQSVGLGVNLVHSYGAPTSLLSVLKPDSAVLNGWAQLFAETGVFVGTCSLVYVIARIRKYNRPVFVTGSITLIIMFLVLAPIYSPPYILVFCCLLTDRSSGGL